MFINKLEKKIFYLYIYIFKIGCSFSFAQLQCLYKKFFFSFKLPKCSILCFYFLDSLNLDRSEFVTEVRIWKLAVTVLLLSKMLNASLLPSATNGQERQLILCCWIFNHPVSLTCDKGSLATLGKNISACNLHHISPHQWKNRIGGQERKEKSWNGGKRGGDGSRGV